MTPVEILRDLLEQHVPDSSQRGHLPWCRGWMVTTDGPIPCSRRCLDARRHVALGTVRQLELGA